MKNNNRIPKIDEIVSTGEFSGGLAHYCTHEYIVANKAYLTGNGIVTSERVTKALEAVNKRKGIVEAVENYEEPVDDSTVEEPKGEQW